MDSGNVGDRGAPLCRTGGDGCRYGCRRREGMSRSCWDDCRGRWDVDSVFWVRRAPLPGTCFDCRAPTWSGEYSGARSSHGQCRRPFWRGAGACIVAPGDGPAKIVDAVLHSDGAFAEDLRLEFEAPLSMNGRSVIMQASRKIPGAISELLLKNSKTAASIEIFLMHQANQNLIDRVARALEVEPQKFYSNIRRYGNTSSASMLIAASEWWSAASPLPGALICFAAFGAGFHWCALLVEM